MRKLYAIGFLIFTINYFSACSPPVGPEKPPTGTTELMDVHGAGAQRSDPKSGDPTDYSSGHGPQGDVVYIYNYARCVRGSTVKSATQYSVVDTGQSKCYDDGTSGEVTCPSSGEDYYGQDGSYTGLTPSYVNNGDDTITDTVTGLMWQKTISKVEWANAATSASSVITGGYSDWRVPTIKELYSLMKFNGATGTADPSSTTTPSDAVPYLDTTVFDFEYPSTGRYIDAQYITSTSYVSTTMNNDPTFFGVNFADGRIKGYPKSGTPSSSSFYVRYVRGNTSYGINSFVDNGDTTITDNATGLTWMKVDSGDNTVSSSVSGYTKTDGSLNWKESLDYCENLTYGGKDDWRLPNAKELHTIVDYTRSPDTTSSAAIDESFSITSISDGSGNVDYPFFWSSTTHLDGDIGAWAVYITFGEAEGFMSLSGPRE